MTEAVRNILVQVGMDYAEFFVRESRYAATWCCVSSYGVFGHHWSHMGCPFPEFARQTSADYLLGKIAKQVFNEAKFTKWLNREIFTSRCSPQLKAEAAEAFRRLREDYSGEALATLAYNDAAISHVDAGWSDAESRDFDPQAVMFVKRMWPAFVTELSAPPATPAPSASPAGKARGE